LLISVLGVENKRVNIFQGAPILTVFSPFCLLRVFIVVNYFSEPAFYLSGCNQKSHSEIMAFLKKKYFSIFCYFCWSKICGLFYVKCSAEGATVFGVFIGKYNAGIFFSA